MSLSIEPKVIDKEQLLPVHHQEMRCQHLLDNGRICDKWLIVANKSTVRVTRGIPWDVRVKCARCKNYTYFLKK